MTTSTNNALTGAAGTALDSLADWVYAGGAGLTDNVIINDDGTGARANAAGIGRYYNNAWVADSGAVTESAELSFKFLGTAGAYQIGVMARMQTDGSGYLLTHSGPNMTGGENLVGIYRYNGSTITVVGNFSPQPLAIGTHTLKLEVVGKGATVRLNAYLNGALIGFFDDSSVSRIVTPGRRGIWVYGASTDTVGASLESVTGADVAQAADATFTLTGETAKDGYVEQRIGTTATLAFSGTYTGAPASIQARLVQAGTNTPLTGFDWATKVASPTGGTFSLSFSNVPQGGMYQAQLRDSAVPGTIASPSNKFGVGVRVAPIGQSNIETLFMYGAGTPHALLRFYDRYRNAGQWTNTTAGAGAVALGNALIAALGGNIPVALINYAVSGAGLHIGTGLATATSGGVARDWLTTTAAAGNPWHDFITAMAAIGPRVAVVIYGQGESDAMTGTHVASYQADSATLYSRIRALLGAGTKIVLPLLGHTNDGTSTAANWDAVRQAQIAAAAADGNVYTVSKQDLVCDASSPDMSQASLLTWGARLAQKVGYVMGLVAYGDGPRITSVAPVSSTVYEVTLAHQGGTDITPSAATQISDILIKDGSTVVTPTSFVRHAANKLRFTLATAPTGTVTVQSNFGKTATTAGIVKDNTAHALPLMSSAPVVAGASITRTVSIELGDASGTAANLSSIMVSLRLGSGPHNSGAVLYQSSTETTDAGGILAFSFDSADISAGGTALLDVLMADGRNLCRTVTVA